MAVNISKGEENAHRVAMHPGASPPGARALPPLPPFAQHPFGAPPESRLSVHRNWAERGIELKGGRGRRSRPLPPLIFSPPPASPESSERFHSAGGGGQGGGGDRGATSRINRSLGCALVCSQPLRARRARRITMTPQ